MKTSVTFYVCSDAPEGWEAIEVERIWAHDEPYRLTARHGAERACLVRTTAEGVQT